MDNFTTADILAVLVANKYTAKHGRGFVSIGNVPEFDIHFDSGASVEVKLDATAASSGRVAIEIWCQRRNIPTGLLSTKSDFWVHCIPETDTIRCYELPTAKLGRLCIESDSPVTYGGDGGNAVIKLLSIEEIKMIATEIFVLKSKLINTIRYW